MGCEGPAQSATVPEIKDVELGGSFLFGTMPGEARHSRLSQHHHLVPAPPLPRQLSEYCRLPALPLAALERVSEYGFGRPSRLWRLNEYGFDRPSRSRRLNE